MSDYTGFREIGVSLDGLSRRSRSAGRRIISSTAR